jgi:pimeloyl-ACP methyl ester carboxylesterase
MLFMPCFHAKKRFVVLVGLCAPAMLTALAVCIGGLGCAAAAEDKKPDSKPREKEEIAKPEELSLSTGDGLQLGLTYYAGRKSKQTIPIVLLHGLKESGNEYKDLARVLQAQGHAVVVPDLRGHGKSTRLRIGNREEKLAVASMSPQQYARMVTEDMWTIVKGFLWDKNNAGELNLDKLCIVGSDMGAAVALNFADYDAVGYEDRRVMYGSLKLGQFVKALALISPKWSVSGLTLQRAVRNPQVQRNLALLILVGKQDAKAMKEAKRLYGYFEPFHPEPTGPDHLDKKTLFFGGLDTRLQGTDLLDSKFGVSDVLIDFIARRLMKSEESKEWVWKERKIPHG